MKINYKVKNGDLEEIEVHGNKFKKGDTVLCYFKGLWEIESIQKIWNGKEFIELDPNDLYHTYPQVVLRKAYTANFKPTKGKTRLKRTLHVTNLQPLTHLYTSKEKQLKTLTDEFNSLKTIYENQLPK